METVAQEKKDALLAGLVQTREEILGAAAVLSPSEQNTVFLGTWSIKDLLAHLTGWDEANIEAIQVVRAGRLPGFYAFISPGWRTYNAALVAQYRREDFGELAELLRASHRRLIELAESVPVDEFYADFGVHFRGYKVTIARLLESEHKDEQEHLEQILSFWKKNL